MAELRVNWSELIQQIRMRLGKKGRPLPSTELALRWKVSKSMLYKIQDGRRDPGYHFAVQIIEHAKRLGIRVD